MHLDTFKNKKVFICYNMSQISSDNTPQKTANQWAELTGQLIDRLVGKNMSITYDFQKLTIDVPKAEGPYGKHIGSVPGEAYDKNKQEMR